jgi:poly-beta-1,6-N-acetyl-D-glucosamine synthase
MEKSLRHVFMFFLLLCFALAILAGLFTEFEHRWPIISILLLLGLTDLLREMVFLAGYFLDRLQKYYFDLTNEIPDDYPLVSVIMPAFNEEVCIGESLSYMYELDYPRFEIVFVDDGSSDKTLSIAHEVASYYPHVPTAILSQPNSGKAVALNNGIAHASGNYVLCVDADSKVHPQSLRAGLKHFNDNNIAGVGGFVYIGNRKNWCTWFQHMEYLMNIQFFRRTLSLYGLVSVVPGPIGLFRKAAILGVGGYVTGHKSFAEDAELTMRMLAKGWKITSDEKMIAVTEAPEDLSSLLRQRYRWVRGMYQATWANFTEINDRGIKGKMLMFHLVWETTIAPICSFMITLLFLGSLIRTGEGRFFHLWMAFSVSIELIKTLLIVRTFKDFTFGLLTLIPRRLFFTYVIQVWTLLCLLDEWLDRDMSWDKLERTGQMGRIS